MERFLLSIFLALGLALAGAQGVAAEDIAGVAEHPMVQRYPGQDIRWQLIENYRRYRLPVGAVTGYRAIEDWIETEGRVTRTFYRYQGADRGYSEIYLNYLEAFRGEGFEILAEGMADDRRGTAVGSRQWLDVMFAENPVAAEGGEVGTLAAGTATQGGAGAFVARKVRAAGPAYVVVVVEQHAADYVGALIDIVEVDVAETGLVIVDAEAIGRDLEEKGRVVLDGLYFDFDKAVLTPESGAALQVVAGYLAAHPEQVFYVVGHTDAKGSHDYNVSLSSARAAAVVAALTGSYGVAQGRLEAHGVGPLVPVFSNASDAGRAQNRRVELVERLQ